MSSKLAIQITAVTKQWYANRTQFLIHALIIIIQVRLIPPPGILLNVFSPIGLTGLEGD